jgi:hypothetical protein
MPVPWLAVGKLVLGNLDTILNVVRPAFTRQKLDEAADRNALLDQQISELQAAAANNAEQVQNLAAQLKERAARRRMAQVALSLAGVALVSSIVALWAVFGMQG